MFYILLIFLLVISVVFVLPVLVLAAFFFFKRKSIMEVSEMSKSMFSQFMNDATRTSRRGDEMKMSREEAYEILGLEQNASVMDINAAYRRLMQSVHPDKGGSSYLAQKLTQARKFLLESR